MFVDEEINKGTSFSDGDKVAGSLLIALSVLVGVREMFNCCLCVGLDVTKDMDGVNVGFDKGRIEGWRLGDSVADEEIIDGAKVFDGNEVGILEMGVILLLAGVKEAFDCGSSVGLDVIKEIDGIIVDEGIGDRLPSLFDREEVLFIESTVSFVITFVSLGLRFNVGD